MLRNIQIKKYNKNMLRMKIKQQGNQLGSKKNTYVTWLPWCSKI